MSSPVLGCASRKPSTSRSNCLDWARLSSRGAAGFLTPRAALNSSIRLHWSMNIVFAGGAANALAAAADNRTAPSRIRGRSPNSPKWVPAFAGTTDCRSSLGSFVFFDRADIEGRDDLRDFLVDEARGDRRPVVVQH